MKNAKAAALAATVVVLSIATGARAGSSPHPVTDAFYAATRDRPCSKVEGTDGPTKVDPDMTCHLGPDLLTEHGDGPLRVPQAR